MSEYRIDINEHVYFLVGQLVLSWLEFNPITTSTM